MIFPSGVALVSVADIDVATENLERQGGTIFTPPTDLAERGRIAVVADAQGALFAMLETRDGDPPDRKPAIGGFLWDEVWAADADAAAEDYRQLVGATVDRIAVEDRAYRVIRSAGGPRFGILPNPVEDLPPLWVSYIRVEDPDTILARVEALGGRVLLPTQDRDLGGKVALIAGPSGAGIALQTWAGDDAN